MKVKGTLVLLVILIGCAQVLLLATLPPAPALLAAVNPFADDPAPPVQPVKLVFIHHSCGENWLADMGSGHDSPGGLGVALRDNNYYVSDVNYGWGDDGIGDRTDIGHWWTWFRGPNSAEYTEALLNESEQSWDFYSRMAADPGGQNEVVMFKSCFPNSSLRGSPSAAPPLIGSNPLRDQYAWSEHHTVANAKGIYLDLLEHFRTRQDVLFVAITAPPLYQEHTCAAYAANARAFNDWLVNEWLDGYPYKNVAVFDFYNVLTSNGGGPHTHDAGAQGGNHHRWWDGAVQHTHPVVNNYAAYSVNEDSHSTSAGNQKATAEFVSLLNVYYNRWAWEPGPLTERVYLPLTLRDSGR